MAKPTTSMTTLPLTILLLICTYKAHASMCLANQSGVHMLNSTGQTGSTGYCSVPHEQRKGLNLTSPQAPSQSFAPNVSVSNPVNILTGNKFEQSDDILVDESDVYALNLIRYYNAQSRQMGMLGMGHRTSFEAELQDTGDTIQLLTADGTMYHFDKTDVALGEDTNLKHTRYTHADHATGYVVRTQNNPNNEHWHWHLPDGRRLGFTIHKQAGQTNAQGTPRYGQLSSIYANPNHPSLGHYTLTYDTQGRLAKVSNHKGKSLHISHHTTKHGLAVITIKSPIGEYHYYQDKHHNLSQVVNPSGVRTGYGYTDPNDQHNLTAKYHYDNHQKPILLHTWQYDVFDRVIHASKPNGQDKVSIHYDDRLTHPNHTLNQAQIYTNTLTNSLGQTTTYRYQLIYPNTPKQSLRLLSVDGAGCSTCITNHRKYAYDDKGRVIAITDTDSQATQTIRYDDQGRLSRIAISLSSQGIKQDDGLYQDFLYQDLRHSTLATTIKSPSVIKGREREVNIEYDEWGRVIELKQAGHEPNSQQPLTRHSKLSYRGHEQRPISITVQDDANSLSQSHTYDDKGNLIAITHQDGQALITERFAYQDSPYGKQLVSHTDIHGTQTHYQYNTKGQLTHLKKGHEFIQIDYDEQDRPIYYHNHLNQSIKVSYDKANNDAQGVQSQIIASRQSNTHTITYTFDDGNSLTQTYDSEQNLIDEYTSTGKRPDAINMNAIIGMNKSAIDKQNATNTRAITSNSIVPNPITLDIDPFGRLKSLTLPQGSTYARTYDDFGRLIGHTEANTGKHTIRHTLDDLPHTLTNEQSNTHIRHHITGQPKYIKICANNQAQAQSQDKDKAKDQDNCQDTSYDYNTHHRPSTITDNHQSIRYVYDEMGNVIKSEVALMTSSQTTKQDTNSSAHTSQAHTGQTHTTAYQYDSLGRLTQTTLPEGIILTHHYDKHSQTTHINYQLPSTGLWQTLTRSLMGNKNQNPLLANIKTSSTQGLVSFTHTNNTNQVNVYDHKDRLQEKHDHTTQTKVHYDKQTGEIVGIDDNGNIINIDELTNAYTYDGNGNRTKHHHTHYTYEPNSDRLSRIENDNTIIVYQYDQVGNPIIITTTNKQDKTVNIRQLSYTPDGQINSIKDNNKLIATYQYNHLRQRIAKNTYDDKQNIKDTTQYLWDKGLLSAEIKDNKIARRYIYFDIMPVAVLDYTYNQKGKLDKTEVYSIHTDHLGTPKAITNQNQETVWSIEMDTFGETKSIDSKNNFTFNLRFAGQYFDTETGYHYNYHRYYDPKVGRYLTSDPIGLAGGLNSYGYANERPWAGVDPLGLDAIFVTFPQYRVQVYGKRIPMTGHAGVVIIAADGTTKYYEYGRYDKEKLGEVRTIKIQNVVMDSSGLATPNSLAVVMDQLSKYYGYVTADYHKRADNITDMLNYAEARKQENNNPDRKSYGIYGYNCMSFAEEVILRGYNGIEFGARRVGIAVDVTTDWPYADAGNDMSYDPKTKKFIWGKSVVNLK